VTWSSRPPTARRDRRLLHCRAAASSAGGFTLLEVIVALAILSVAVVASIQGFAQGLRLLKLAGDHQQAMLVADQKTREVIVPTEGREQGREGEFAWDRTITVVDAPDLTPVGVPVKWRVFQIGVTVKWNERRQVEITTLRTVPATSDVSRTGRPEPPGSRDRQ
jgi:general secretion pathway protein I